MRFSVPLLYARRLDSPKAMDMTAVEEEESQPSARESAKHYLWHNNSGKVLDQ
jgi:hypothetical protein